MHMTSQQTIVPTLAASSPSTILYPHSTTHDTHTHTSAHPHFTATDDGSASPALLHPLVPPGPFLRAGRGRRRARQREREEDLQLHQAALGRFPVHCDLPEGHGRWRIQRNALLSCLVLFCFALFCFVLLLCCAVLCLALMCCYAMLCYAMSSYVMLCYVMSSCCEVHLCGTVPLLVSPPSHPLPSPPILIPPPPPPFPSFYFKSFSGASSHYI